MNKIWDAMTNEELCVEYQSTQSDELYEYFVKRNEGLMHLYVNKYIGKYPSAEEDFMQAGRLAIWQTMKKVDTSKGLFSTYFGYWAKKELLTVYRRVAFDTLLPRYLVFDKEKRESIPNIVTSFTSLYSEVGNSEIGEESYLIDFIIDKDSPSPEELAEKEAESEWLKSLIKKLPAREQRVISLRMGFNCPKAYNLQEIGTMFGVSRERIRQVEEKALRRLRYYVKRERDKSKD